MRIKVNKLFIHDLIAVTVSVLSIHRAIMPLNHRCLAEEIVILGLISVAASSIVYLLFKHYTERFKLQNIVLNKSRHMRGPEAQKALMELLKELGMKSASLFTLSGMILATIFNPLIYSSIFAFKMLRSGPNGYGFIYLILVLFTIVYTILTTNRVINVANISADG